MIWMTPRRFAWTLRARGPELAAWPLAERAAAVCLLRHNAAARDLLADALANEDAPLADPAALGRITCPVQRALSPATPLMRGVRWGALAACLAAGLYLGSLRTETDGTAGLSSVIEPATSVTVLAELDQ